MTYRYPIDNMVGKSSLNFKHNYAIFNSVFLGGNPPLFTIHLIYEMITRLQLSISEIWDMWEKYRCRCIFQKVEKRETIHFQRLYEVFLTLFHLTATCFMQIFWILGFGSESGGNLSPNLHVWSFKIGSVISSRLCLRSSHTSRLFWSFTKSYPVPSVKKVTNPDFWKEK